MMTNTQVPRVQTQEIKIEVNTLYSLHKACVRLEHAARDLERPSSEWKPFPPTQFIYSYFTFNSIYSFNWERSLRERRALKWKPKHTGGLSEAEQFKELLNFYYKTLDIEILPIFRESLQKNLARFGILDPEERLKKDKS
jgi:hypothetical protein